MYCKVTVSGEDAPVCCCEYWTYWFGVGSETDGLCIASSCTAVRGTIPVSTASGWTLVIEDYFPQHNEDV
jgi:hypothetical protein